MSSQQAYLIYHFILFTSFIHFEGKTGVRFLILDILSTDLQIQQMLFTRPLSINPQDRSQFPRHQVYPDKQQEMSVFPKAHHTHYKMLPQEVS